MYRGLSKFDTIILRILAGCLLTAVFTVSAQINNTPTATTANTDVTFLPANSSENMLQSKMSADEIVKTNCSTCHDVDGLSVAPIYPALAGQHVAYIEKQLISFKQEGDDRRENAIMRGMAAGLTTQNITALAQYFSARSPRKGLAKNTENLEFGRKLWRGGNVHFHIASCTGCHGPNGLGIPSLFPRLAGQNTEYTTTQLTAFQKQTRTNDQNSMMRRLTERMTEKDIAALANFMEGLR